jgi:hypothetical protein
VDPEHEAPRAAAPGWPPPHPSPPLPPPREYGTPGTPLAWRPWLWGALAAVVVGALVTVGLVLLLPDAGDEADHGGAAGGQPTTSASATVASTSPAPAAPYRCWDGSDAQQLKECSHPTGVEGLRWVFPAMADDRCAKASKPGDGAELRVLCVHVLEDGTRAGVGYFEWSSVKAGKRFYGAQGLAPTKAKGPDGRPVSFGFFGVEDDQVKSASLFADEPLSFTITFPVGITPTAQDVRALSPRPVDQLRGAPVG